MLQAHADQQQQRYATDGGADDMPVRCMCARACAGIQCDQIGRPGGNRAHQSQARRCDKMVHCAASVAGRNSMASAAAAGLNEISMDEGSPLNVAERTWRAASQHAKRSIGTEADE
ncbi:hypothetical protein [Xanthomonas fragariae]|uniref:hypothetical protein n=1 Tax=Xanthomonas fragariae TaxID=48664 RepID=UPI00138AC3EE|nr:hypothetical protein [Xanthomonas fragariae]MBL9196418.1 hypothetical protein [Xanthomonas fragariae]MBL9221690.1 hypothetical protein [Xanthomonas fragariae]WIY73530.1 hypothetical protein OW158_07430 [Xanthomonas fragariae]